MTGELWLPGAHRDPGANAGYNAGSSTMQLAVNHYTVGSDSRGIARRGYFHILVHQDASRENGCTQYAEIDAVTFHAGGSSGMPDANQRGPGIEYERRVTGPPGPDGISEAEPLTANQLAWGTRIVEFLATWGIPPVLYDGPRYGAGNWRGFVNHQALDRDRSDGLTREEWARIVAPPPAPPLLPKGVPMFVLVCGGLPFVAVVPDLPECYEVLDPGNATTVVVTPEQRAYIINDVRRPRDT